MSLFMYIKCDIKLCRVYVINHYVINHHHKHILIVNRWIWGLSQKGGQWYRFIVYNDVLWKILQMLVISVLRILFPTCVISRGVCRVHISCFVFLAFEVTTVHTTTQHTTVYSLIYLLGGELSKKSSLTKFQVCRLQDCTLMN